MEKMGAQPENGKIKYIRLIFTTKLVRNMIYFGQQ
jgi:hypothetical protein